MAIDLRMRQEENMRDQLEKFARAQHEMQENEVRDDISDDKISYGTSYHPKMQFGYAAPPNYYYGQPGQAYQPHINGVNHSQGSQDKVSAQ